MKYIRLLLSIFDYFTQKKILSNIKKIFNNNIDTVLDVGAHEGEFALSLNKSFNIKKIISFEPNKKIFIKLIKQTKKRFNIEIVNFGVGENNERKKLNINTESSSSSINELRTESNYYKKKFFLTNFFRGNVIEEKITIDVIKLDDYINKNKIENIDLLKIDTEGFEFSVLKGTDKNLKYIRAIYFEHHFDNLIIKNYNLSDIHDYLIANGFKKYFKIKMKFRKSFEYIYINKTL